MTGTTGDPGGTNTSFNIYALKRIHAGVTRSFGPGFLQIKQNECPVLVQGIANLIDGGLCTSDLSGLNTFSGG